MSQSKIAVNKDTLLYIIAKCSNNSGEVVRTGRTPDIRVLGNDLNISSGQFETSEIKLTARRLLEGTELDQEDALELLNNINEILQKSDKPNVTLKDLESAPETFKEEYAEREKAFIVPVVDTELAGAMKQVGKLLDTAISTAGAKLDKLVAALPTSERSA